MCGRGRRKSPRNDHGVRGVAQGGERVLVQDERAFDSALVAGGRHGELVVRHPHLDADGGAVHACGPGEVTHDPVVLCVEVAVEGGALDAHLTREELQMVTRHARRFGVRDVSAEVGDVVVLHDAAGGHGVERNALTEIGLDEGGRERVRHEARFEPVVDDEEAQHREQDVRVGDVEFRDARQTLRPDVVEVRDEIREPRPHHEPVGLRGAFAPRVHLDVVGGDGLVRVGVPDARARVEQELIRVPHEILDPLLVCRDVEQCVEVQGLARVERERVAQVHGAL